MYACACRDAEKEAAAFYAAGLNADREDSELLDDSEIIIDENKEIKARRAAERHLRARERVKQASGDRRDVWHLLLGLSLSYFYFLILFFLHLIISLYSSLLVLGFRV